MLTYFPTPYPGEWWYSVLCRYHVRSGNIKNSVTIRELYGGKVAAQGKLFPGADCATVVARIPNAILDLRQILIEHTLMPYYLRFYPKERKEEILSLLLKGKNVAMTSKELCSPDGTEGLKFCTQCYDEDVKQFGEPFWHREHQIPLMPICFRHRCRLKKLEISFSRLSEVFLPLSSVSHDDPEPGDSAPWVEPLAEMLRGFLELPFEITPPTEYSNLKYALLDQGYGIRKIQKKESIDVKKIINAAAVFYGKAITDQYLSKLSHGVLQRLLTWKLTSPERYALLAVLLGLNPNAVFGEETKNTDVLLEQLCKFKKSGVAYSKKWLSREMGISPSQLDSLVRKYGIEPFWKQCGRAEKKRTQCIRIMLTPSEMERVKEAARKHGNGQLAVFARMVLLTQIEGDIHIKVEELS
nr:TniQ family protein [uncultured Oscillibacter sp.]